ncbi:MAG: cobalamin B12-binding domain-containing protein [Ignavibacteriaceae bacterium]|nr:cobalamin B12-binding domain-containing protein [Ignavibacteriaceae bacterium]
MINQSYFFDFYNNLVEGNKAKCEEIVQHLLTKNTDIKEIYTELYQKALYRIGKLWDQSKISISEEHVATKIVDHLISSYLPKDQIAKSRGETAIVTCVDKEYHEIGAKMAANILELNGWSTLYLGASVPSKDLIKFIRDKKPKIVGISFNLYLNLFRLVELLDHIKKFFPEQMIIIGGQGLKQGDEINLSKYSNTFQFDSIFALDEFLKKTPLTHAHS